MAYKSIFDIVFPKPTKEELSAEKARKREEAQRQKQREKKWYLFQKGCAYEEAGDTVNAIKCDLWVKLQAATLGEGRLQLGFPEIYK